MNIINGTVFRDLLPKKNLIWVTLLTLAMGMLESAVVIYLRELYYPDGFKFPLRVTSNSVALTEVLREMATIIMLVAIGILAGKKKQERFAWFIYSFAIWDISYYLFLNLIIGWPVSIFDWDILFLIPVIWVGPVWAPLLLSALMILLSFSILYFSEQRQRAIIHKKEWIVLITGALTVIIAFCKEYYLFITTQYPNIAKIHLFFSNSAINYAAQFIPVRFDTGLFLLGCFIIFMGIFIYTLRNWKS